MFFVWVLTEGRNAQHLFTKVVYLLKNVFFVVYIFEKYVGSIENGKRKHTSATGRSAAAKVKYVTAISNENDITLAIFISSAKIGSKSAWQIKTNKSRVSNATTTIRRTRTGNENIEFSIWDTSTTCWNNDLAIFTFSNNSNGFPRLNDTTCLKMNQFQKLNTNFTRHPTGAILRT